MKYFYQKESKEILDELNTTTSGLDSKEVEKRQEKYGLNVLPEAPRSSAKKRDRLHSNQVSLFNIVPENILSY